MAISEMKVFSSVTHLIERAKLAALGGFGFGGARDYYKVLGYSRTLSHADFMNKYLRQDVAQRIINAPVDATWQDPPQILTKINGTTNDVWQEWETFARENDIYMHLAKADLFAGLGSLAILVVGFDDGRRLDQPVGRAASGKLLYLQPYLEGSVDITQFDTDMRSPRFGQPTMYTVTPGDVIHSKTVSSGGTKLRDKFEVHYTRVLHLADNTLENSVYGHSRLEPLYNTLDDLMKVTGGSAETYWLLANRGMHIDVDKDMDLQAEDAKNLSDEIDEYQHQLRRVLRTRGVTVKSLGSDAADPKNEFGVLMSLLSAGSGLPQRVMMGAEAGQLASQQDRANWAARVAERIAKFAQPKVLKPFVQMMGNAGVIKLPPVLDYSWPEAFKMNPLERAQTSAQMARSATNVARALSTAQTVGVDLLSVEESRAIIAPTTKMPEFIGPAVGTMTPPIQEMDPQKFEPTVQPAAATAETPAPAPAPVKPKVKPKAKV